jgi:HPt (histidine-containing phosphotransfer) domain-containing protein
MISKEIQARFLPRFVPLAMQRLVRCRAALDGDATKVSYELHALSGEAATLGLTELAAQARAIENALKAGDAPATQADGLARMEAELATMLPGVYS